MNEDAARFATPPKPGEFVIIRQNPHDVRSENVVGIVIAYRTGAGFLGCDVIEVKYESIVDGSQHALPFGLSCLEEATPSAILNIADGLERRAAHLRELAALLSR